MSLENIKKTLLLVRRESCSQSRTLKGNIWNRGKKRREKEKRHEDLLSQQNKGMKNKEKGLQYYRRNTFLLIVLLVISLAETVLLATALIVLVRCGSKFSQGNT